MSNEELQEDTLLSHLIELRSRLLKAGSAVLLFFVVLVPFSDVVFKQVALPLMQKLPEGSTMIATQVASPFFTPFKTTMFAALFLAMPVVLYQLWSSAAPK
jgi:sec-independent protein translocase protein TatC